MKNKWKQLNRNRIELEPVKQNKFKRIENQLFLLAMNYYQQ